MMTSSKIFKIALMLSAIAFPASAFAQTAQEKKEEKSEPSVWRFSTGVNYSTGDYGDVRDTDVISAPVSVKYSKGPFSVRVSVPFVHISGPGSLIDTPQGRDASGGGSDGGGDDSGSNSGSGSSNSGSGRSGSSGSGSSGSGGSDVEDDVTALSNKRSGIGDVSVAMAYSFDFGSDLYLDTTARVKLPTASRAKRLGTGKIDVTLGADIVKDIGKASLYVGGRRKFVGSRAISPLRDVWGFGGGASVRASKGVTIGADYDWQQSATPGNGPSSEVTGWTSFRLSKALRMQVFASTGFTTNSADFAGGVSFSWRFQ